MISFPEEERGTAIGFYGLVGTAGLTLGPLVGGVFTEYLSGRWIFAINPIVMVAVIFVVATIWREPVRPDVGQDVDWRGLAILATALGALVFAIMQASTWGWGAPATVTLIVVGLVALVLFRYVELRTDDPLIDVTLFGRPSFTGANLGVFMAQLSKSTVIVFLPLYLQSVLDFSAIEAGLALMPGMAMNLLLALPGGRLVDRVGPGWPLIVGLGGLVVAHVWIAGAVDIDSYALLLPALLTWGAFTVGHVLRVVDGDRQLGPGRDAGSGRRNQQRVADGRGRARHRCAQRDADRRTELDRRVRCRRRGGGGRVRHRAVDRRPIAATGRHDARRGDGVSECPYR
jgi:MFS family permease